MPTEEFIDYAKIVMGTLGHKVFEPLVQEQAPLPRSEDAQSEIKQDFFIKRSGANARSWLTNEGMVILAGSVIRGDMVPSCPDYVKKAREANREDIDENNTLLKDLLFKTPSGASSFVLGAPSNGNIEWRTEDGKDFKDVENSEELCDGK